MSSDPIFRADFNGAGGRDRLLLWGYRRRAKAAVCVCVHIMCPGASATRSGRPRALAPPPRRPFIYPGWCIDM